MNVIHDPSLVVFLASASIDAPASNRVEWTMVQVNDGKDPGSPVAGDALGSRNGQQGTSSLFRSIAADISTLVSKQIELAKQEIGEMVGARAKAVGVFGAAAVLGLFVIGFLGMAGAEALDLVLPRWAAMLITAGVFAVLAAIAIVLARGWLRSSASKPELTQESLKEDVRWAKQQLKR
jgi:MFS family permease